MCPSAHQHERTELGVVADGQDQLQSRRGLFLHQAAGERVRQTVPRNGFGNVVPGGVDRRYVAQAGFDRLQLSLMAYPANLALQHDGKAD